MTTQEVNISSEWWTAQEAYEATLKELETAQRMNQILQEELNSRNNTDMNTSAAVLRWQGMYYKMKDSTRAASRGAERASKRYRRLRNAQSRNLAAALEEPLGVLEMIFVGLFGMVCGLVLGVVLG